MTWDIGDELIMEGLGTGTCRLVGSIVRNGEKHFVEVLWSGNDITFEAKTRGEAEAFVRGVEAIVKRMREVR